MAKETSTKASVKEYEGAEEKYEFRLRFDWTGCPEITIYTLAARQAKISWVNANRGNGVEFLRECVAKGIVVVHWSEIAKKVKSDHERIGEMVKNIMLMTGCTEDEAKDKLEAMLVAESKDTEESEESKE